MLEVAMEGLKHAAVDFYNITKIEIVLYDDRKNVIYAYPEELCDFCAAVRQKPELADKCMACDSLGFTVCDRTKQPYIYRCHMSLSEAIAPICENNIIIGYMMLGQVLCGADYGAVVNSIAYAAQKYGLNRDELLRHLKKFSIVDESFIRSAVTMMSMCACYLYYNRIIQNKSDVLAYQIEDYIKTHLADDLSVAVLCKKLYLSRSKLYRIARENFQMGISDYIRKIKIEKAKALLQKTEKPIFSIAEETGFSDANYFVRAFKKYAGVTPGAYKKRYE